MRLSAGFDQELPGSSMAPLAHSNCTHTLQELPGSSMAPLRADWELLLHALRRQALPPGGQVRGSLTTL